ncbi:head-tail connector protein [Ralstonia pseudosolanacearum]|uniref:head-tail connector protein n=1 Tax=Ralstonia pseudosolanacearum TaxID=1310165 RepID=UPI001FF9AA26|nr:head-tail connector protein [Ralstonia pseudosolanacearum]
MIEISEIREQLRIEPEETSDTLLLRYLRAALRLIESRTNRKLYPAGAPLPADAPANALQLDDDLVLAALLLVGHFDENRSDSTAAAIRSIPMGAAALIEPYRWFYDS